MQSSFLPRHLGPRVSDYAKMLQDIDATSLDNLIEQVVPENIRSNTPLEIPDGISEEEALLELKGIMNQNVVPRSMIGQGYHDCHVPPVILRNMLENPAWYTAYTPYQPEISQGRLEMLFNFQTLITELTGLPVANASLLDEATAVAEAAIIAFRQHKGKRSKMVLANQFHPQTLDVVATRGKSVGYTLSNGDIDEETAALLIQYPDTYGVQSDMRDLIQKAKQLDVLIIFSADPLALVLFEPPGNLGADMVVGSIQRFGVPMGNGGPHAAFMATTEKLTRIIPGRIIGQSIDSEGRPAYRLALQTREQHIRREKATSNICTAQALLANMAAAYAIWHGPIGLRNIAMKTHQLAARLAKSLQNGGFELIGSNFFDTVTFKDDNASELQKKAEQENYLVRKIDNNLISIAFDETSGEVDLQNIGKIIGCSIVDEAENSFAEKRNPKGFMSQEVFWKNRCETEMMRFFRSLSEKDLGLNRTMIPLGSCTMKLNSAAEMMPVSWEKVNRIHPFAPSHQSKGYQKMFDDLDAWLSTITGFAKVSLQPNAGSQGEFAGLKAISRYHAANAEEHRSICLIPSSAHGTNPASAQMAGYKVVVTKCLENGDIDLADLREKAELNKDNLAALMITYPSTHGVFETNIREVCQIIHDNGGQVYLDGANLNAMVGLAKPGELGADVCHLNLHKTFCIPHGGGGPGIGPIGVAKHLVPHLPGHTSLGSKGAVSAAPFGSASILPITWMYIRMLGGNGLVEATRVAILNANYLAVKLKDIFPVLYTGQNNRVAHECIIDPREYKKTANISVDDIAKRLMDFGFHAPTMSWPVVGTLMIEPTESESLEELDRFVDALTVIHEEIENIENGVWPKDNNPLSNAPHIAEDLLKDNWDRPYSREVGGLPRSVARSTKFWPPVSRIDNMHGDKHLVCSCPPLEDYID